MNKKYFITTNTNFIQNYIEPINYHFNFSGKSLNDPAHTLEFDFQFTEDFFKHVHFYEAEFNDKGQPVRIHCFGKDEFNNFSKDKDDFECPNGWIDLANHLEKIYYHHFFLKNDNGEYYFNSNGDLFVKLLEWARETAECEIKGKIIDFLEYGE